MEGCECQSTLRIKTDTPPDDGDFTRSILVPYSDVNNRPPNLPS